MKTEEFKLTKNGARATIDGVKVFFSKETLYRFGIDSNKEYTPKEFAEIYSFNEKLLAKDYLLTLLSRYRKSQADASRKLKSKGYSAVAIAEAIKFAKEYGYLDDALFAEDYVKETQGRKGAYKIKHDLLQKGIKKELVEEALAEINDEAQLAAACKICTKIAKGEQKGYKLKQKMYSRLMQSGFASSIISRALKGYDLYEYGDTPEYDN